MNTYIIEPLYNRKTGKLDTQCLRTRQGTVCDACGDILDEESDNMPYTGIIIEDLHGGEDYFCAENVTFTPEESLELFGVARQHVFRIADMFDQNPYIFCVEKDCLRAILEASIAEPIVDITYHLLQARIDVVRKLLIEKQFTPAQLGISEAR